MTSNRELVDKNLIRRRFGHSVPHYDQVATPQKLIAEQLIGHYPSDTPLLSEGCVFEVGCGTGILSELLVNRFDDGRRSFVFNDLSSEVERTLRIKVGARHTFSPGDAERMEWPQDTALIASSSCIQWWHAPLSFIAKGSLSLRSGGTLLYSTFLPDNLSELRNVTRRGLHYPTTAEHHIALQAVGFRDIELQTSKTTLTFDSIIPLLRHLKLTGTNGIDAKGSQGFWSPERIERMETDYRSINALSPNAPLPLTYSAVLVCAKKK